MGADFLKENNAIFILESFTLQLKVQKQIFTKGSVEAREHNILKCADSKAMPSVRVGKILKEISFAMLNNEEELEIKTTCT